ncbi:MAG: cytochrome c [Myxococcaceae bacterium]|nr:cytochrome c [Myxococcaceae bacterium]
MKTRLVSFALVLTAPAFAAPPADAGAQLAPPATDAGAAPAAPVDAGVPFVLNGDPKKGKKKFDQLCASCHGPKGKGDGTAAVAAKLDPRPTNFTDAKNADRLTPEWVYQVIRDGGPTHGKSPLMVSWGGTLTDPDVRDLASHVLRFKPAPKPKR